MVKTDDDGTNITKTKTDNLLNLQKEYWSIKVKKI